MVLSSVYRDLPLGSVSLIYRSLICFMMFNDGILRLPIEFLENVLSEGHGILGAYRGAGNQPHASVGYDVTSCFWSTAKCN